MDHRWHKGALNWRSVLKIIVIKIPHVSDRRMAIADMHGIWSSNDALAAARTRTHYKIVLSKIKSLPCPRHKRQQKLMMSLTARPILDISCANIKPMRPSWGFHFIVHKGVNRCIGPNFMKALKNLLCTALAHEPVVNQSDFWLFAKITHAIPSRNRRNVQCPLERASRRAGPRLRVNLPRVPVPNAALRQASARRSQREPAAPARPGQPRRCRR